jgi:hypothetical protein
MDSRLRGNDDEKNMQKTTNGLIRIQSRKNQKSSKQTDSPERGRHENMTNGLISIQIYSMAWPK